MTEIRWKHPFVTEGRIRLAANHASELAAKRPWASAHDCAERAVRTVFGRWLLDPTAAVRPDAMPLFLQLVNRVEGRLGVHRGRLPHSVPDCPPAAVGALTVPGAEFCTAGKAALVL